MTVVHRKQQILQIVKERCSISIQELNGLVPCSLSTLQRDIRQMHESGLLHRNYGQVHYIEPKASLSNENSRERSLYDKREWEHRLEKEAIARKAAEQMQDGDVIYITHGTTTKLLARFLPRDIPITVFTDGLDIVAELSGNPSVRVFTLGGCINYTTKQVEPSPIVPSHLLNANIGRLYMGVGGISMEKGITFYDLVNFEFLRNLINQVPEIIILADSSKFDRVSLTNFISFDSISSIITDHGIPPEYHDFMNEKGVLLQICKTSPI